MRTNKPSGKAAVVIMLLLLCTSGHLFAQSWSINGNASIAAGTNYLGTSDANDMVFRSNAVERGRLLGTTGDWRFGTAANYVSIDVSGRLRFTGNAVYQVAGNRYAFQFSGNPNLGLYFNSTLGQFEFRDAAGLAAFTVVPSTGAGILTGTLRVGAYTLPATDGAANQVLKTNGAGVLAWSADNNNSGWGLTGNSGTSTATNFIGTTDAVSLVFRTSNTEKMRLLTDGKLGIGTTAPTARLHINGASGEDALRIQTNGSTRLFVDDAGGVSIGSLSPGPAGGLYVSGNVGIGNSSPVNKLDVSGSIGATGSVSAGGDLNVTGDIDAGGTVGFGSVEQLSDIGSFLIGSNSDFVTTTDGTNSLGTSANTWFDVWATDATINTSDAREKSNIKDLNYGLKEIMQLRSVRYNWKKIPDAGEKLGLIAQEVQKILPEVVRDWEFKKDELTGKRVKVPSAKLGIAYDEFIPVLIRSVQQQQDIINEQNQKIEALTQLVNRLVNTPVVTSSTENTKAGTVIISSAVLDQNVPNPFNSSTTISYNLPQKFTVAQIVVTDKNGKTLKNIKVNNTGKGMLNIDASTLASGAYSYSLIVDGKIIDSKQMILTK